MQLYYLPGSPFLRLVRIVALELDAPVELIEETEFPPVLVRTLNPSAQVPTLTDGTRTLFGARLIADYLMAEYPSQHAAGAPPFVSTPTRPSQHWHDAQVLLALEALLVALVARSYLIWTGAEHRSKAAIRLDLAKHEEERVYRLLDWLEQEATPTGFVPNVFSLQDIWLICAIGWTEARINIEWRGRPNLEAIYQRFAGRPSVLATIPSVWQPDV
jgi:glutathione S-transferase